MVLMPALPRPWYLVSPPFHGLALDADPHYVNTQVTMSVEDAFENLVGWAISHK